MNTLIIYGYEEQSIVVLLDEDEMVLASDYANGMMWTIENSLIEKYKKKKGITLSNSFATNFAHLINDNQILLPSLTQVSIPIELLFPPRFAIFSYVLLKYVSPK